ncbi:MAG: hypothetical protein WBG08_10415 [Litorimonas sp.]
MDRFTAPFVLAAALCLSACSTVSLPDVDFMGQSDFSEDIAKLDQSYPRASEIPPQPADVRTAEDWDRTAREMQALDNLPDAPESVPALSPEEFDRRFEAAKAAAEAYKADDPQ